MKAGPEIVGDERPVLAERVAPRAERVVGHAHPDLAADGDGHVEFAGGTLDHGRSPDGGAVGRGAGARGLGRPVEHAVAPVFEVGGFPAAEGLVAPGIEGGVDIAGVAFLNDGGVGVVAGEDGIGRVRGAAGHGGGSGVGDGEGKRDHGEKGEEQQGGSHKWGQGDDGEAHGLGRDWRSAVGAKSVAGHPGFKASRLLPCYPDVEAKPRRRSLFRDGKGKTTGR